jgi:hypothetical protein
VEKRGEKDYFSFEDTDFNNRLNEALSFLYFLKNKSLLGK